MPYKCEIYNLVSVIHLVSSLIWQCVQKAFQKRGRQFINQQTESAVISGSSSSSCARRVDSEVPGVSADNPGTRGCSHVSRLSVATRL